MCQIIDNSWVGCDKSARKEFLRRDRLATGICTKCGAQPAATGVVVCQACRNKHNMRNRSRYNNVLVRRSSVAIANGMCAKCNISPHRENRTTCESCGNAHVISAAKRHARSYREMMNTPYKLWLTYQRNAKTRKLDFSLTLEEFECLVTQPCMYCGKYETNKLTGLDRIDNLVGYCSDNVLPCCSVHNHMKCTMTIDEFLDSIESIARRIC